MELAICKMRQVGKLIGYRILDCKSGKFRDMTTASLIKRIQHRIGRVANLSLDDNGKLRVISDYDEAMVFPNMRKNGPDEDWPVFWKDYAEQRQSVFVIEELYIEGTRYYRVSTFYGEIWLERADLVEEKEQAGRYEVINRYEGKLLGLAHSKDITGTNENCQRVYQFKSRRKMLGLDLGELTEFDGGIRAREMPKEESGIYVIPEFITELGEEAFKGYGCIKLKLHDKMKRVGPYCFYHCIIENTLVIPSGLHHLDYRAFTDCNVEQIEVKPGAVVGDVFGMDWILSIPNDSLNGQVCKKVTLTSRDAVKILRYMYRCLSNSNYMDKFWSTEAMSVAIALRDQQIIKFMLKAGERHADEKVKELRVPVSTAERAITYWTNWGECGVEGISIVEEDYNWAY